MRPFLPPIVYPRSDSASSPNLSRVRVLTCESPRCRTYIKMFLFQYSSLSLVLCIVSFPVDPPSSVCYLLSRSSPLRV